MKTHRMTERATRSIVVRFPYSDARAEAFLRQKARQLPKEAPGIVMIDVARATAAMRTWAPLLSARLRPDQHTRVSAICLFRGGILLTPAGEDWVPETIVITNPHARYPAPDWLVSRLRSHEGAVRRLAAS
jgi:hypothetical protein